jgi:hypothetical protein
MHLAAKHYHFCTNIGNLDRQIALDTGRLSEQCPRSNPAARSAGLNMAYKKLSDAMSGKPPAKPKPAPGATNVVGNLTPKPVDPKSSVSTREKWANAMNKGDRATADKLWAQMKAEEAAAKK